jgi:hypothetical protein
MGPYITERQYEFAVNFELTNTLGVIPVIPSTNQESKEGWDARFNLGTGWIYQPSVQGCLLCEPQDDQEPGSVGLHAGPYYRFSLLEDDWRAQSRPTLSANWR